MDICELALCIAVVCIVLVFCRPLQFARLGENNLALVIGDTDLARSLLIGQQRPDAHHKTHWQAKLGQICSSLHRANALWPSSFTASLAFSQSNTQLIRMAGPHSTNQDT